MSSGLPAIPLSDQNGQKDQKEQKNVKQSESKLQVPTNDPVHAPLLAVVNEADWAAVADTRVVMGQMHKRILEKDLPRLLQLGEYLSKNPNEPKCLLSPVSKNHTLWSGYIDGPPSRPYAFGRFHVKVFLPSDYPFRPPQVRFVTPILHINVDAQGNVILGMIRDDWSPMLTLNVLLISLQSVLSNPIVEGPANLELCRLFQTDRATYECQIQMATFAHALSQ